MPLQNYGVLTGKAIDTRNGLWVTVHSPPDLVPMLQRGNVRCLWCNPVLSCYFL